MYIAGGNPFYLLYHLIRSGADEILKGMSKKDVVIVGVSAGSMILGENIEIVHFFTSDINTVNLTNFTTLQIISTNIFPHYDRNDLFSNVDGESIEDRLKNFEERYQCKVLRLKDDETATIKIPNKI